MSGGSIYPDLFTAQDHAEGLASFLKAMLDSRTLKSLGDEKLREEFQRWLNATAKLGEALDEYWMWEVFSSLDRSDACDTTEEQAHRYVREALERRSRQKTVDLTEIQLECLPDGEMEGFFWIKDDPDWDLKQHDYVFVALEGEISKLRITGHESKGRKLALRTGKKQPPERVWVVLGNAMSDVVGVYSSGEAAQEVVDQAAFDRFAEGFDIDV